MNGFPFHGVLGHDDLKLALLLCAVDPSIGGVLLRGEKGSAKTTLARAFAPLLPGAARFVDLPVGATEDRVVGSIDLVAILNGAASSDAFRPGLLHRANGGVLYIDEVNLLPDHLVDVLLDVAATGVNRVERDGVSHEHPARFILVGSMNPEEGELRPQFLDRFGLVVDVHSSVVPSERAEAVRRRLDFDRDPALLAVFRDEDAVAAQRLRTCSLAEVPAEILNLASAVAVEVGAEGLRADLTLCRAAGALAAWEGRIRADESDLRRVLHLVLAHRRRRGPLDPPTMRPEETSDAFDRAAGGDDRVPSAEPPGESGGGSAFAAPPPADPSAPIEVPMLTLPTGGSSRSRTAMTVGRSANTGATLRGRTIGDRPMTDGSSALAVIPTLRRVGERRGATANNAFSVDDLRAEVRESKVARLIVFAVDASGSMATRRRIDAATGAVMGLLGDAYRRRDRVALVSFAGTEARVVLRPTGSVELARARVAGIPVGGATPLAAGLAAAHDMIRSSTTTGLRPLLVVLTDGRATEADGSDPFEAALIAGARLRNDGVETLVVDVEDAPIRLNLAGRLAEEIGATYVRLDDLVPGAVESAVRKHLSSSLEPN